MTDVNASGNGYQIEHIEWTAIKRDGGTQTRAKLDPDTVTRYADDMRRGTTFPAITVFYDGKDYWLADGFHRVEAALQAHGSSCKIEAEIRQGTRRDAVLHSAGANATHGLPRTSTDKQRAVQALLNDEEWRSWSDRKIADITHTTHPFVGKIRAQMFPESTPERKFERGGQEHTMNTGAINADRPYTVTDEDRAAVRLVLVDGPVHKTQLERRALLQTRIYVATIKAMQDSGEIIRDGLMYRLPELPDTTPVSRDAERIYRYLVADGGEKGTIGAARVCSMLNMEPTAFTKAVNLLEAEGRLTKAKTTLGGPTLLAAVIPTSPAEGESVSVDKEDSDEGKTVFELSQRVTTSLVTTALLAHEDGLTYEQLRDELAIKPTDPDVHTLRTVLDTLFGQQAIIKIIDNRITLTRKGERETAAFLAGLVSNQPDIAAAEEPDQADLDPETDEAKITHDAEIGGELTVMPDMAKPYRPFRETVDDYREWKNEKRTLRVTRYRDPGNETWHVGLSLKGRNEGSGVGGDGNTPLEALRDARRRLGGYFPNFILTYDTPEVLRLIKKVQGARQIQRLLETEWEWKKRKTVIAALESSLEINASADQESAPDDALPALDRDGNAQPTNWLPEWDTTREIILARARQFTAQMLRAFWRGQEWQPSALHLDMEREGLIEFVYKWSSGSRWWIGYTLPTPVSKEFDDANPNAFLDEMNRLSKATSDADGTLGLEYGLLSAVRAMRLASKVNAPDWSTVPAARRDELIALLHQAEDAAAALLYRVEETWWPKEAPAEAAHDAA